MAKQTSEKDSPLRSDVRVLGAIVGDMLREQEGVPFFEWVEQSRLCSIRGRDGDEQATAELERIIAEIPVARRQAFVRAFSVYFAAVNMGEQIHRLRRRRDYERSGPQANSPVALLQFLKTEGISAAKAESLFHELILEPIFTAHPTEAVRRTLLTKQQRIARALVDRIDAGVLTPVENQRALERVQEEITAAWQTEEHFDERPQLADEVEHVLFYLSRVIYRIVPSLLESFEHAFEVVYQHTPQLPPFLRFGSWVGGDMDGNPFVGAETIWSTLHRHRDAILELYGQEVTSLLDHLSQSQAVALFSDELLELVRARSAEFPKVVAQIPVAHRNMPYRVLLHCLREKLAATRRGEAAAYLDADAFERDLATMLESLQKNKGTHAGLHRVRRLRRRVQTFGFHFATLDTRQDSEVHQRVCGELLGIRDFPTKSSDERTHWLRAELQKVVPIQDAMAGEVEQTLAVFRTLAKARQTFGARAIGPSIISMARGADDVLAVLYLARAAGLVDAGQVPLDVAPLFETVADLQRARQTMQGMFEDSHYQEHLAARGQVQVVMLGYSDSGKDSGIASARWALYQAQEELVEVADRAGVKLVLFHGRGGTVSRGGTKVTEAIPAQAPGSVRHRLRVTEQGEIIHSRYGLRGIAQRTLEVMAASVLKFSAREEKLPAPTAAQRALLQGIAEVSRQHFRELVYADPRLFQYLQAGTPLDVIARMRIGSRPSARRQQKGIQDLRAIPWVFSWMQARLMLPGSYGVAAGLEHAIQEFGLEQVRQVAKQWSVLRALLSDVEMVMAKADLNIAERYSRLAGAVGAELFPQFQREFERTRALVCEVKEIDHLLEQEPWLAQSIQLRNPYIDPMSLVQIQLLEEWRNGDRQDTALERTLFTTVKGIARGLMNTG